MSGTLNDTPYVGRKYCPGHEPEADPTEEVLEVSWCDEHKHEGDVPILSSPASVASVKVR